MTANTLVLGSTGSGTPTINKVPSLAYCADPSDFSYSGYNTAYVTCDANGQFTATGATSSYSCTVIAMHKMTDQKFVFAIIIGTQPTIHWVNYVDQGYQIRFNGLDGIAEYCAFAEEKLERLFGVKVTFSIQSYTSAADICKIDQFGAVTADNLAASCSHSGAHSTTYALREAMGSGTPITVNVLWTGHILDGNPRSDSLYDHYSVVITPFKTTTPALGYGNSSADTIMRESKKTILHELTHQLGTPDHYCYGDPQNKDVLCTNSNCDIHYLKIDLRDCLLSGWDDVRNVHDDRLICSSCIEIIHNHLTDHHR